MGKRSDFERNPRDYYPTPMEAVLPLTNHLPIKFNYVEPCAGDGRLCNHIEKLIPNATCVFKSDIEPQNSNIEQLDALKLIVPINTNYIITNPPWERTKNQITCYIL